MFLFPRRRYNPRRLREFALSEEPTEEPIGLPIRSNVDVDTLETLPPLSNEARNRIRNIAKKKKIANDDDQQPNVTMRASILDGFIPIVKANMMLRGIDGTQDDPTFTLQDIRMIWDTGAHRTMISDELLSDNFRQYLTHDIHSPYRSADGLVVQLEVGIAFTNCPVTIEAVAKVVAKEKMPNRHVGVLFGEGLCIDRLNVRNIPREILLAKGEDIEEGFWGDIVIDEYVNDAGEITRL